jgi:SAM-dependent methyltransferase
MDDDRFFEELYQEIGHNVPWAALAPRPALLEWLDRDPPRANAPALVIACGLGDDAEELARRGLNVLAFDYAPTAIAEARRRFPHSRVDYRVADLFELPDDWHRRFEWVVEVQTIMSIEPARHREAIKAIADTVAPGGKLFVRTAVRADDEPADKRPWPLTQHELDWFAEEGLTLAERFEAHDDGLFVHLGFVR